MKPVIHAKPKRNNTWPNKQLPRMQLPLKTYGAYESERKNEINDVQIGHIGQSDM